MLTLRGRIVVLAVCLAVALAVAGYAATRYAAPAPQPTAGSVRLGPEPGEEVAAYLARLPTELPAPGGSAFALVQLGTQVRVADVPTLAGDVAVARLVFRVPVPRVQTALRFVDLAGPGEEAARIAMAAAAHAAAADAARLTGRQGAVAAAEERALTDPECPCVLALLVQADRARLERLAGADGVRAVHAAPAGVTLRELALAPLLPEQRTAATPLPDDGSVPGP